MLVTDSIYIPKRDKNQLGNTQNSVSREKNTYFPGKVENRLSFTSIANILSPIVNSAYQEKKKSDRKDGYVSKGCYQTAKNIIYLANVNDQYNGIYGTQDYLAKRFGKNTKTLQLHLAQLKSMGWITISLLKWEDTGKTRCSQIHINDTGPQLRIKKRRSGFFFQEKDLIQWNLRRVKRKLFQRTGILVGYMSPYCGTQKTFTKVQAEIASFIFDLMHSPNALVDTIGVRYVTLPYARIADKVGCSYSTVCRVINKLEAIGVLYRYRVRNSYGTDCYRMTIDCQKIGAICADDDISLLCPWAREKTLRRLVAKASVDNVLVSKDDEEPKIGIKYIDYIKDKNGDSFSNKSSVDKLFLGGVGDEFSIHAPPWGTVSDLSVTEIVNKIYHQIHVDSVLEDDVPAISERQWLATRFGLQYFYFLSKGRFRCVDVGSRLSEVEFFCGNGLLQKEARLALDRRWANSRPLNKNKFKHLLRKKIQSSLDDTKKNDVQQKECTAARDCSYSDPACTRLTDLPIRTKEEKNFVSALVADFKRQL